MAPPLKAKPPEGLSPEERKRWLTNERSKRLRAKTELEGGGPFGAYISKESYNTLMKLTKRYRLTKAAAVEALFTHKDAKAIIRAADKERASQ